MSAARLILPLLLAFHPAMAAQERAADLPGRSRLLDQAGERTTLKTAGGATVRAYVVGAKDAKRGVLVLPAAGVAPERTHAWAERFAALDYRAIVVPRGNGADGDQNRINALYRAALEALREPGRALAVFGWCDGGAQALEASLAAPDLVAAAVVYFDRPAVESARLAHLKAPVLVVRSSRNGAPASAPDFVAAMHRAGKLLEVRRYAGESPCARLAQSAPDEADRESLPLWQAVREFLNRELR